MNEILTTETVAEILGCDERTVFARLVNGDLPGTKFGRSWIIPAVALFQRINELALEEAAERRRAANPTPVSQPARKRGRPRFTLPE